MDETIISIKEAARRLRVSESTVRRYFDSGRLEGFTTGSGTRRIYEASVTRMLDRTGLEPEGITFP
jgi:excisionase family DNA binding protein